MNFEEWLEIVDQTIRKHTGGLSHLDLPDRDYYCAWEADPSHDGAVEMAEDVLREEGFDL